MSWTDGEEALRDALQMEKTVTASIKQLVQSCDGGGGGGSDFYAADWLSGEDWLGEQLEMQRQLAGMVNTLATFRRDHEQLADWMFSNQIAK